MAVIETGAESISDIKYGIMVKSSDRAGKASMFSFLTNEYGNYFSVDTVAELDAKVEELLETRAKGDVFAFKGLKYTVDAQFEDGSGSDIATDKDLDDVFDETTTTP